jgi:hypothetical protein
MTLALDFEITPVTFVTNDLLKVHRYTKRACGTAIRLAHFIANRQNGASQDSFFPDPTALPWAEQLCTTPCGD